MTVTKFDYSKRIRDLMKDRRDEEKILANKKKIQIIETVKKIHYTK